MPVLGTVSGPVQFTGEDAVELPKTKRARTWCCTSLAQKRSTSGTTGEAPATGRERVAFQPLGSELEVKLFSLELIPL